MSSFSSAPIWRPAGFFEPAGERLVCSLCPHRCVLGEGDSGLCRVRRHHNGRLESATLTAGVLHEDSIERKPFFHVRPGARVMTRAAPGCNMRCSFCLNFRLSQFGRSGGIPWRAEAMSAHNLAAAARAAGCIIGFSFSEPALAAELVLELAECDNVPPVVWKSNGFLSREVIAAVAPHLEAVNIDLKCPDPAAHLRLTGAPLAPVFAAVEAFLEAGVWVELSTPLTPGFCADDAALSSLARRIAGWGRHIPWHLLRFSPDFRMRDAVPSTPSALADAVALARAEGLWFVYVERALGEAGRQTACPQCGSVVLRRELPGGSVSGALDGVCPSCGFECLGRW